ncbi:MAG: hypothetical protein DMG67_14080 [Acidobacteria bacterium]|nr:MAG: hypothetical protein DMG67_14080 [Acidobacteriota bacterium]
MADDRKNSSTNVSPRPARPERLAPGEFFERLGLGNQNLSREAANQIMLLQLPKPVPPRKQKAWPACCCPFCDSLAALERHQQISFANLPDLPKLRQPPRTADAQKKDVAVTASLGYEIGSNARS